MDETQTNEVITYWAQGEINSFIKVWISAFVSLCYCYSAGKILPEGAARLTAFLPVMTLFLLLPLPLHSLHLVGIIAFLLACISTFKLLLFAFGKGPLSTPSISLPRFIAIVCLPFKFHQKNPPSKSQQNGKINPSQNGQKPFLNYAIKALLFALIFQIYAYKEYIHPRIMMAIYSFHIYLSLELILAVAAAVALTLLGVELEPQPDENDPNLSTSLQDFWGRQRNIVTRVLRPIVYHPVLGWSSQIFGREWAPLPAAVSTSIISGLTHALIFYYLGRVKPTWEITCFLLLHGAVEILVKKVVGGAWRLPRFVGTALTVALTVTGFWLLWSDIVYLFSFYFHRVPGEIQFWHSVRLLFGTDPIDL